MLVVRPQCLWQPRNADANPLALTNQHSLLTLSSFAPRIPHAFSPQLRIPPQSRGSLQVTAAVRKGSSKNVVCCKVLVAREGQRDQVAKLCQEVMNYAQPRISDKSLGLLEFNVTEECEGNTFHFWERYESNVAMGRFNTHDAMQTFMEKIQQHLEGPVGMVLYDYRDGQIGSACLQGGPKGEGGLDDATGAGGRGGAGYTQTSKVVDLGVVRAEEEGEEVDAKNVWGLKFKLPWQKKAEKDKAATK